MRDSIIQPINDEIPFAEEFTGQFRSGRQALSAIALADAVISNNMDFENVFACNIEALGRPGDVFFALTTSGNSPNLAFLGKTGGKMNGLCDLEWIVSGLPHLDRIQEAHMTAIPIIFDMVERQLI